METLIKKLQEIQDLLKANFLPSPNPPAQPKAPGMVPVSRKDPAKVAAQKPKEIRPLAMKQAKEQLKTLKNGQWTLNKL